VLDPFKEMEQDLLEKEILYNSLINLGDAVPLDIFFDSSVIRNQIKPFESEWKQYNSRKPHIPRFGLSLTSIDGQLSGIPDLDSLREYNLNHGTNHTESSIQTPTPVLESTHGIKHPIDPFLPFLGRSHLIRFGEGGYFPPHRDFPGIGADCFRLIALLDGCCPHNFVFIHDGKLLKLQGQQLYFLNTKREHALFSFSSAALILVLNIRLNPESVQLVVDHLQSK
jgi:hypothetical protein